MPTNPRENEDDPAETENAAKVHKRKRGARSALTQQEVSFCSHLVLTGNVKQASLQAGYSAWWGYELLKQPRILQMVQEFQARMKDETGLVILSPFAPRLRQLSLSY